MICKQTCLSFCRAFEKIENYDKAIAESKKGKRLSDEHRKSLSDSHKGYHWKMVDGKRVFYRNGDR